MCEIVVRRCYPYDTEVEVIRDMGAFNSTIKFWLSMPAVVEITVTTQDTVFTWLAGQWTAKSRA